MSNCIEDVIISELSGQSTAIPREFKAHGRCSPGSFANDEQDYREYIIRANFIWISSSCHRYNGFLPTVTTKIKSFFFQKTF